MSVEPVARVIGHSATHEIRPASEGVFIKPGKLDGDGELFISSQDLGLALTLLDIGLDELWPPG